MLRILSERALWWPVIVQMPSDGGSTQAEIGEIQIKFPLTREIIVKLGTIRIADKGVEMLMQYILDWRGPLFQDESGGVHPFTPEALKAVIDVPAISVAIQEALIEVANGKAAAKNLKTGASGS